MLEHEAHFGADFVQIGFRVGHVHAVHPNFARSNGFQLVHRADECGFARTGRPAHHHHFTLLNVQVHTVNHMQIFEIFVNVFEAHHDFLFVGYRHFLFPLMKAAPALH